MKYTKSADEIERTSIQVIIRLDKEEIQRVKDILRERGEPFTDSAVREYVRNATEYLPAEAVDNGG